MLTITNPKNFDWSSLTLAECAEGNAMDSHFTLKLFEIFEEELEVLGITDLYEDLIAPVTPVFSTMEFDGLDVAPEQLDIVGRELRSQSVELEDRLYSHECVNAEDNLNSGKNLTEILYLREDALELYPTDLTPKGSPSVSAPTLKIILDQINEELVMRKTDG